MAVAVLSGGTNGGPSGMQTKTQLDNPIHVTKPPVNSGALICSVDHTHLS